MQEQSGEQAKLSLIMKIKADNIAIQPFCLSAKQYGILR